MTARLLALFLLLTGGAGAAAEPIENIRWELLGKLPHSRGDFVQGLEIRGDRLFQGTGRWGQSRLQVFELQSGRLLREQKLPDAYFGEGVTVFGDKVIQLTWRQGLGLVFAREDLRPVEQFPLPGQGWGLSNDGERLIYSDGSHLLRFISPGDWKITGSLPVLYRGEPLGRLNELEWTPNGLFANVFQQDVIVRIDMASGAVTGIVNLAGLLPPAERDETTDVLNGIAFDTADNTFWVTGKNWPWLYQVRLLGSDWEAAPKKQ